MSVILSSAVSGGVLDLVLRFGWGRNGLQRIGVRGWHRQPTKKTGLTSRPVRLTFFYFSDFKEQAPLQDTFAGSLYSLNSGLDERRAA